MTVQAVPVAAREIMSRPVITASPDDSPWDTWQVMLRAHVRHVVLAVDGRCAGVVDDRTLVALWPMGPVAIRQARIAEFVRHRTACVLPDADIREVAVIMIDDRVDAVPVIDADGRLIGLVTASDVVSAVARYGVEWRREGPLCD